MNKEHISIYTESIEFFHSLGERIFTIFHSIIHACMDRLFSSNILEQNKQKLRISSGS